MNWILESNRPFHVAAGTLVFTVMLAYFLLCSEVTWYTMIGSWMSSAAVSLAFESKDIQNGNKWDWLDALATVLLPSIASIVELLIILI